MTGGWQKITSMEECVQKHARTALPKGQYCNATYDTILCWPPTPAGTVARQYCPPLRGLDTNKYATRNCTITGHWEGTSSNGEGYTDYLGCYDKTGYEAYKAYLEGKTPEERMAMKEIAKNTRAVEVAGLAVSLVALAVSLFIFSYFRSLKCSRTKIHVNLFSAMLIQVLCRLVLYIDQYVARLVAGEIAGAAAGTSGTISDTRVVCEALYILMEYTWTVMFMWMFIEGLYLHNQITVSVFSDGPNFKLYHCIGWGVPLIITIPWVITVAVTLPPTEGCWLGIEFLATYWIIQGPRLVIFAINLTFLVIIISVLVNKLKESRSSEAEQVRKAVKAAILLLPLLGITNIMGMVKPPSDTVIAYGVYSYTSHILSSFQGFLVALFYCFLNGEVRQALSKHWDRYWQRKGQYRRTSRSQSLYTSETEVQSTFPGKGFVKIQLAKSTQKSKLNNGVHAQDKTSGSSCEPDTTTL